MSMILRLYDSEPPAVLLHRFITVHLMLIPACESRITALYVVPYDRLVNGAEGFGRHGAGP